MSFAQVIKKQPDETLNLTIDFTAPLGSYDVTGTPTVVSSPSGLTIASVAIGSDSKSVDFVVSGGTTGVSYTLTANVTSTSSEILEGEALLVCRDTPWQATALIILRNLLDDFGSSPTYSDDRLEDLFLVGAFQVVQEISLDTTFTIDIANGTISPVPDNDLISLATLKAACIIDRSGLRKAAMVSGLEARCGPAQMRTLERDKGFALLMKEGYCKTYDEARNQYIFGNAGFARAIMSPFVSPTFDPSDYADDNNDNITRHDR